VATSALSAYLLQMPAWQLQTQMNTMEGQYYVQQVVQTVFQQMATTPNMMYQVQLYYDLSKGGSGILLNVMLDTQA
jgi:hypothetical protein